ncbi:hypothetical protein MNEG_13267 [Monoraphidium neglectum]|uniref:Uncharacterized protein n=1 Tax=Monoraphidium neglectum TaxID=145388 RepID=A0A0D2LSW1_9CHLO|nr:hypothetical protein MNEG_13267 [Monoraphidium neglectum]KIY94694.1 hypothetical protein MNEG_13267 [Monoraphidium neglectum]|eukprot:XP_013893714.1 hypothetical protein MNEG_13267 [Monoraphidium neglectum]
MVPHFADVLQAFNADHIQSARPLHASMVLGAAAYLAKNGHPLREPGLAESTAAGVLGRFCSLLQDEIQRAEVTCQDAGDVIWSLSTLGLTPPHHQLRALAERGAEEDAIADSTPAAISKLLWSLTELIAAGAPPPLSPGGAEWARLVEGYSHAAEARGYDKKAASFYREAVSRLSTPGGRGGQCVSRQLAQRCMAQLSVGR